MAKELWHPDIDVTLELAKKLIISQFHHEIAVQDICCIGSGWDNKVYLVNNNIIFRFPHREVARQLIERENAVLSNIQNIFALTVPKIEYIGNSTSYYPYTFHGYRKIPGISGCHAQLSEQQRKHSVASIAHFLKRLHQINGSEARSFGATESVFDRTDRDHLLPALEERVDKLIAMKICSINKKAYLHEAAKIKHISLSANEAVLVHGDMYCRHILFQDGILTGVIDWGDVAINHPSVDLALLYSFYPADMHEQFYAIYGEVEEKTKMFARFLGLYSALTVLLYASDIKDELLLEEALAAVKRINPALIIAS